MWLSSAAAAASLNGQQSSWSLDEAAVFSQIFSLLVSFFLLCCILNTAGSSARLQTVAWLLIPGQIKFHRTCVLARGETRCCVKIAKGFSIPTGRRNLLRKGTSITMEIITLILLSPATFVTSCVPLQLANRRLK